MNGIISGLSYSVDSLGCILATELKTIDPPCNNTLFPAKDAVLCSFASIALENLVVTEVVIDESPTFLQHHWQSLSQLRLNCFVQQCQ